MGNFFFKDQNTTMNEQSNSQNNNPIIEEQSNSQNNNPIIEEQSYSQNIVKPDEIDWDEIDRSVDEFLLKIEEMKANGLFDSKFNETEVIDEDW